MTILIIIFFIAFAVVATLAGVAYYSAKLTPEEVEEERVDTW